MVAVDFFGNLVGDEAAEVAGVVVHDATVQRVVNHLLVYFVYTTSDRLH